MFSIGMSAWDKASMQRGQEAIAEQNEQSRSDFCARFELAILEEEANPVSTSINDFCARHGFSIRTLAKPVHLDRKNRVLALPTMHGKGNPNG